MLEICKLSVIQNGTAFKIVKEQIEKICKLTVRQDSWVIFYVKDRTEELNKLAVQNDILLTCKRPNIGNM